MKFYYSNLFIGSILILVFIFDSCDQKKNCNIPLRIVDYSAKEKSDIFTISAGDTLKFLRNNKEVYSFVAQNIISGNSSGSKGDGNGCDTSIKYFFYFQNLNDNIHLKPLSIAINPTYGKILDIRFDDIVFQYGYKDTLPFNDTVNTQFAFYNNILAIDTYSNKKLYFKSGYGIIKIIDNWGNLYERIP